MIKKENGKIRYFDKNGLEITEGCKVRASSGEVKTVYLTVDGELGTDATNPKWIECGRAVPGEYGIYPLSSAETDSVEIV